MPDDYVLKLSEFMEEAKRRAVDGVSTADVTALTLDAMRIAMTMLDGMVMDGKGKKAEVLRVAEYFFDSFADLCVPTIAKPLWWLMRPAVKALVMQLASGAVEALLPIVRGDR